MIRQLDEAPELSAKQTALQQFFREGGSVCPFATIAAKSDDLIFAEPFLEGDPHEAIWRGLAEFALGAKRVLIIVGQNDSTDHKIARQQAIDIFVELWVAAERLAVSPTNGDADHIQKRRHYWHTKKAPLFDPLVSPKNPMLDIDGSPLFTVGMGPGYQSTHPRHAPHNIVVVTWMIDVRDAVVNSSEVVWCLRRKLREIAGDIYDGDQLYIVP